MGSHGRGEVLVRGSWSWLGSDGVVIQAGSFFGIWLWTCLVYVRAAALGACHRSMLLLLKAAAGRGPAEPARHRAAGDAAAREPTPLGWLPPWGAAAA